MGNLLKLYRDGGRYVSACAALIIGSCAANSVAAGLPSWWSSMSLYANFKEASIYECEVQSIGLIPIPPSLNYDPQLLEVGLLKCTVVATISGKPKPSLLLPYSHQKRFLKGQPYGPWPWSELPASPSGVRICVFVTEPDADAKLLSRDVDGIVTNVFICSRKENPVKWIQEIAKLSLVDDVSVLGDAVTSDEQQVRRFAVDRLVSEFATNHPDDVASSLVRLATMDGTFHLIQSGEMAGISSRLSHLGRDRRANVKLREMALRILGLSIAKCTTSEAREILVGDFAAVVATKAFRTPSLSVTRTDASECLPFASREVFSPQEVADILKAVIATGDDQFRDARGIVSQWLAQ